MDWQGIARIERMRRPAFVGLMAVLFAGFHTTLYLAGIRFDSNGLWCFLHFADPELLKTRLLESCYYFHVQPPLFNLFVGIGLKLAGDAYDLLFNGVYLVFGFLLYLAVVGLMRRMNISRTMALALGTWFMLSPSFVLFEYWLFYTFPCTLLLTASAWLLPSVVRTVSTGRTLAFFLCLMALCGLWSLFHLLWFVLIVAGVCWCAPGKRGKVLALATVPLLLVLGLYVKNAILFGNFGPSSILGRNLWINAVGNMSCEEREGFVRDGRLSPISWLARWNSLDYYPPEYRDAPGFEGIPVLRNVIKANGVHNFNHVAHIRISKAYMNDAVRGIMLDPASLARSMIISAYCYFRPPGDYFAGNRNSLLLSGQISLYDYAFFGKLPVDLRGVLPMARVTGSPPYLFLLAVLPLLFAYGLRCVWRGRGGGQPIDMAQRALLVYCCFTILYVASVGILCDFAETNRYRFATDPMYLMLFAMAISGLGRRWRLR